MQRKGPVCSIAEQGWLLCPSARIFSSCSIQIHPIWPGSWWAGIAAFPKAKDWGRWEERFCATTASGNFPSLQQKNQSSDCPDSAHNKPHPNQGCVQGAASLKIYCKQSDSSTPSEFCLTRKGSCKDSGSVSPDTICGFWEYNDIYFVPFTCSSIGLKSSSSGKSPPHPTFHADILGWSLISLWVWHSSKLLRWFSGDFSC